MKFVRKILFAFLFLAPVLSNISAQQSVVDSLKLALSNAKDDGSRIELYRELGHKLLYNSPTEALDFYNKSVDLAKSLNDTTSIVSASVGICSVYSMQGEYKRSLALLDKVSIIAGEDPYLLSLCHNNIAVEYYKLGRSDLFLEHSNIAQKYNLILQDSMAICYCYNNIGSHFIEINNVDSADYYLQLSLDYLNHKPDKILGYIYDGLGSVEKGRDNLEGAIAYYTKSKEFFKREGIDYELVKQNLVLASLYKQMDDIDTAMRLAMEGMDISDTLKNFVLIQRCSGVLSILYEEIGNHKEALFFARQEKMCLDTLEARNKVELIEALGTKHALDLNKKNLEISEGVNDKLSNQRRFLVGFSLLIMLLLFLITLIYYEKNKEHKVNKELVIKLDVANQSIRKILGIISHDLRGSVGNLKNFTQLMHYKLLDNESIDHLIRKFVPMVNSTHHLLENLLLWAYNNEDDFTTNCQEISAPDLLSDVVSHVSHLANTKHINVEKKYDSVRFCADRNILLTILRNLLTNAIKFSNRDSDVLISCEEHEDTIDFKVSDKGVGMSEQQIQNILDGKGHKSTEGTTGEVGSGLGLYFCNSLLNKHGGKLTIRSEENKGSDFIVTIPKKQEVMN